MDATAAGARVAGSSTEAIRTSAARASIVCSRVSKRASVTLLSMNWPAVGAESASTSAFHASSCWSRPRVPSSVWSERMSCLVATIRRSMLASSARSDATWSESM